MRGRGGAPEEQEGLSNQHRLLYRRVSSFPVSPWEEWVPTPMKARKSKKIIFKGISDRMLGQFFSRRCTSTGGKADSLSLFL